MPMITHNMALMARHIFSGAPGVRNRLSREIRTLIADLETLMNGTEARFLDLGRLFQDIHRKAGDVSSQVICCMDLIRSDDDGSGLTGLTDETTRFVQALFDQQAAIGKRLAAVEEIIAALSQLTGLCDDSNHIVLLLSVIALNIGIESRRCDASQDMFTVFIEEVRALAVEIGQVAADLDREARDIRRDHRAALKTSRAHLLRMSDLARVAREDMDQATRTLTDLMKGTRVSLDAAAACTRQIGSRAAEIVVALQFHDIIRQKVEHITATLTETADQLKRPSGRIGRRAGLDQVRTGVTVLRIQERQLDDIHHDIAEAVEGMSLALEGIEDHVVGLYRESRGFLAEGKTGDEDPVDRLMACLQSLAGVQEECLTLSAAVTDQVHVGAAATANLQRHVTAVKRISLELHRKALNAIIKAAHLGNEGRSIEVFAQEVTTSSQAANRFVEQVIQIIGTVQTLTEGLLADETSEAKALDGGDAHDLSRSMDELARTRQAIETHQEAMAEPFADLEKALGRAREQLMFFPDWLQDLDGLIRRLSPMIENATTVAGLDFSDVAGAGMISTDHYTMESERRAHEQALGGRDESGGPEEQMILSDQDIGEQIKDDEGEKRDAPEGKESGDLGDNVELF
jgi:methyl-accepting chemotaxis protein